MVAQSRLYPRSRVDVRTSCRESKIFVVNLDRRLDRLASISTELNKRGLKFERVSAVDWTQARLAMPVKIKILAALYNSNINPNAAYACFMSHRLVWQKMIDEVVEQAIILEDDAQFINCDERFLNADIRAYGLDLLRIGANSLPAKNLQSKDQYMFGRRILYGPSKGSCAYIITNDGAQKCLNVKPWWFPVDHFHILSEGYGVRTALVEPLLVVPDGSASDLRRARLRSRPFRRNLRIFATKRIFRTIVFEILRFRNLVLRHFLGLQSE